MNKIALSVKNLNKVYLNSNESKNKHALKNVDIDVFQGEIHEYILKNWRLVKIATTKAQRKLFFNLRSKKKSLDWLTKEEAEKIASDLNVEEKRN